jgi:hypothetical protein
VPLRAGNYSIGPTGLSAESGEIANAKWHTLKALGESRTVPESLAGDVVVLATPDAMPRARESVASLLSD